MTIHPIDRSWMTDHWPRLHALSADLGWDTWQREHFLSDLPGKWELSFRSERDGEIAGYAIVSRKGAWLWLHHLIVGAAQRGQGLGQALIQELERRRVGCDAKGVRLKVARTNERALAFYRRLGYRLCGSDTGTYLMLEKVFPGRQKIVAIHQPNYLPWLGYFHKMAQADDFVILDDALTSNNSFINRNRIKQHTGELWLTVPVRQHLTDKIGDVGFADAKWANKHLKTIRQYYARAPFFATYFPTLEAILQTPATRLAEVNVRLIEQVAAWLEIRCAVHHSSALQPEGTSDDRLISLVTMLHGDVYLSGKGGANYQSAAKFQAAGLGLAYQEFRPPIYPQLAGAFVPGLSVIDLLFNCGPDARTFLEATSPPMAKSA